MCGESDHGLFISHQVLEDLYGSERIGEIAESAELMGNLSDDAYLSDGSSGEDGEVPDSVSCLELTGWNAFRGCLKKILHGRMEKKRVEKIGKHF